MEGARRSRWVSAPLAYAGVVVGAVLFPYCLALGYWNGDRRSRGQDGALFILALLIPCLFIATVQSWVAVVLAYVGATIVGVARLVMRRRNPRAAG
jgi:hypothetical protein